MIISLIVLMLAIIIWAIRRSKASGAVRDRSVTDPSPTDLTLAPLLQERGDQRGEGSMVCGGELAGAPTAFFVSECNDMR